MVANATVMSVFCYMIAVWGGTEAYIISAAQVIQNRAARLVTKRGWFTSQKILLKETNWLSIRQMIFYHTILQVWRVKKRRPKYLNEMFNPEYGRQTRNITEGNIRIQEPKTSLGKKAIRFRGASMWNQTWKCSRGRYRASKSNWRDGSEKTLRCEEKVPYHLRLK